MGVTHRANKGLVLQVAIQIILLIVGMFFSYSQHIQYQKQLDEKIADALNTRLTFLSTGISNRLDLYKYGLSSLRGFIHGVGINDLNYQAIANYSNSRDYALEFPGASGIGYIKRVYPNDVNDFINTARNDRPDHNFNISVLSAHNEAKFVIQYLFPEKNNISAIGLDIGSGNMRREAALDAALYNRAQLSGPITLVQADKKTQQGFLILLPVYNSIAAPTTQSQRIEKLVGWTYSPLLIDNILKSLSQLDDNYLTITDLNSNAELTFFNYGNKNDSSSFIASTTTDVMGRTWKIALTGSHTFIKSLNLPSTYQTLLNNILIIFLVMLLVLALQLFFYRKGQQTKIKIAMAKKHELALEHANSKLETEVKLRTQQIADISTLQRSILHSASYTIIATDKNGVITAFNPAAEKLLGYTASQVIGLKTPAIFHLEDEVVAKAKQLSVELNKHVEPGFEVFSIKATATEPDINQWTYVASNDKHTQVNLSVTSLLSDVGEVVGFLGISYDLTQQIVHEQALAQAKELAEQASDAKSEFLANMSHEIRTPMNGLFGTLQLLQEQPLSDVSKNYLDKALYSTKALITIINDILDFSKIEAGKLLLDNSTFEFEELIHHLESDLAIPATEKGIYLRFNSHLKHKYWRGDAVRIRQVFLNLISNAIKFTREGGVSVEISVTDDNKVCFVILDTGIGIPEQDIPRLFERFEQAEKSTTREFGGTGLGLPITKSLISLMNGEVKVTSQLGVGSQFTVYLPLKKANIKPSNVDAKSLVLPDLTNKTILIAEDNPINQLVASAMIKPSNANIVIANNGLEAIELYESLLPDLILMDIQMPKMDGMQACKHIKKINSEQIIIALTANVLSEQKQLYKQLFDGYLSKPIEKQMLVNVLNRLAIDKLVL